MASTEAADPKELDAAPSDPPQSTVNTLAELLANANIQEGNNEEKTEQPPRELHVYTHSQLLWLSKSPLVKVPDGMPALKDWFGDWSEQQTASKKEGESSNGTATTRERRFRRDAEEGDAPTRPSFRSSLSQPSQMGNFRHQSLRTADRDRDPERERQREERDREGQERLRNLSDKYDRERLALSSVTSALRGKDRDAAPHLAATTGRNGQGQTTSTARRTDGREPAKKKPGEVSDDWRRGAEPPSRGSRDDRSETTRRDRGGRDTSRSRRDPSTSRRDRDGKERDRSRRRDERDEPRKDRDDYFRRDWEDRDRENDGYRDRDRYDYGRRDPDRDGDEDPRRWRDDGKRDERVAARRDRDRNGDREKDRDRERGWDRWEPSHDRDRADDRDGRSKRNGRDRRSGAGLDDTKERDDRREREKEKEPAWMETYVPTTPSGGILGGQLADGELDGIQAWKKGLKEKEKKEKEKDTEQASESTKKPTALASEAATGESAPAATADGSIDEIQLFKLLMKQAKKDSDHGQGSPVTASGPSAMGRMSPAKLTASSSLASPAVLSSEPGFAAASSTASPNVASDGSKLLSLFSQASSDVPASQASKLPTPSVPQPDNLPPAVSRMFPAPPGLSPSVSQNSDRQAADLSTTSYPNTPFDPPASSRLLAFGARAAPANPQIPKTLPESGSQPFNNALPGGLPGPAQRLGGVNTFTGISSPGLQQGPDMMYMEGEHQLMHNPRATPSERSARSFSPFGQPHQQQFGLQDAQDNMRLPQAEAMRRMGPSLERTAGLGQENSAFLEFGGGQPNLGAGNYELGPNAMGAAPSGAKGSRFAKFFDKNRDAQANVGVRKPGGNGFASPSPHPGQGRDAMAMNAMLNSPADARSMEDLVVMLQNSSHQGHRASPQFNQTGRVSAAGGPFGQPPIDIHVLQQQHQMQLHQQQQQQQQQLAQQNARLDSLYDSRMDDRNFVPDGMVPGLRLAPRPRSREPTAMHFNEHIDEPLQVNPRLAQQQRNLEQLYAGPSPSYTQQASLARLQQQQQQQQQQNQFRNGPGMLPPQNLGQGQQQRLPPGLANLGGRPPHDASQFLNSQLNSLALPHNAVHMAQQQQQQQQSLNNFGGVGFNGPVQGRGPINGPHHNTQLLNQLQGGMGPGNGLDMRAHNQAQLLGLGAGNLGANNGVGGGLRGAGVGVGFNGQQQHNSVAQAQLQREMALRQQAQQHQQQHLQHLGMPPQHMLPPHLHPQQQNVHANSQGAQDLMALLMGGQRD